MTSDRSSWLGSLTNLSTFSSLAKPKQQPLNVCLMLLIAVLACFAIGVLHDELSGFSGSMLCGKIGMY